MSDQYERIRIELRLSRGLAELVDQLADAMGLRRNAFFVFAAAKMAIQLIDLFAQKPGAKRDMLLDTIEKHLLDELAEARKAL